MTGLREAAQMALNVLEHGLPIIEDYGGKQHIQLQHKAIAALYEALRAALATEHIECTPMPPVDDDGWCEWSYPKHKGYLMQCCDCGLVHEVEFHVLGNLEPQEDGSMSGEVMESGYQVGLRMRRHSEQPEPPCATGSQCVGNKCERCAVREWVGLTDEERQECLFSDPVFEMAAISLVRVIEAKLKEKNGG